MKSRLFLYALAPLALWEIAIVAANASQGLVVLNVRQTMQHDINPATMEIWDVGNNAMGDDGGMDPAQMTPEKWAQLETAAKNLRSASLIMYNSENYVSVSPENMHAEVEPGAVSMEQVQRYIDADPDGFREAAKHLSDHAERLLYAVHLRDTKTAGDLVGQLDQVCEACHATYWYPDQP